MGVDYGFRFAVCQQRSLSGILNINCHRVLQASAPAAKPANTQHTHAFRVPFVLRCNRFSFPRHHEATPHSNSPHRPCPPDDDPPTASRTPSKHPCGTTWPRQPFVQPQKGLLTAGTKLKIGPPTAVRLRYHRRPHPHILPLAPPSRLPISPHLNTKRSPPPAGRLPRRRIQDRAARPPF